MNPVLLNYYEAIEKASQDLLEAARAGNWDHVVKLEGACALLISQLKHAAAKQSLGTEEASLEAIKLCIEHGADVRAFNDLGETALHGAAQRGADKVVRLLAVQGATLDWKNRRGRTPLDDAIGQARDEGEDVRRPERKSTEVVLRELMGAQKPR